MKFGPAGQRGFGLIATIFVVVAIGGLMFSINQIISSQGRSLEQGILSVNAQYAAESGMDWAIHSAVNGNTCTGINGNTFNISDWPQFDITTTCTYSGPNELGATVNMYELTATAVTRSSYGAFGDDNYVYKQVTAVIEDVVN